MTDSETPGEPPSPRFQREFSAGAEVIDELSHVSNVAYVGWIQDIAKAHSAAVGWDSAAYFALGAVFVVRRHEIEYLASIREGERVRAVTWIEKWSAATSERHTRIERASDGTVAVRAKTVWAMIDFASGRPRRVPKEIRDAFLNGNTADR
ncbi:MAG: thioesterase family protein [Polyangiaceae bacterium]